MSLCLSTSCKMGTMTVFLSWAVLRIEINICKWLRQCPAPVHVMRVGVSITLLTLRLHPPCSLSLCHDLSFVGVDARLCSQQTPIPPLVNGAHPTHLLTALSPAILSFGPTSSIFASGLDNSHQHTNIMVSNTHMDTHSHTLLLSPHPHPAITLLLCKP